MTEKEKSQKEYESSIKWLELIKYALVGCLYERTGTIFDVSYDTDFKDRLPVWISFHAKFGDEFNESYTLCSISWENLFPYPLEWVREQCEIIMLQFVQKKVKGL